MKQKNKKSQGQTSQGEAANLIQFDTYLRNRLYHFSKALEALDLQRKDYNRDDYLKHLSHYYPPYVEESLSTRNHIVSQHWPYRRTNSFHDNINQIDPRSYETTVVQNDSNLQRMSSEKPQLFINFRGRDERLKLLPHLKHHLKESEVKVVTDEDAIGGEPLDNLFKYIRKSRIVIVIFSTNYLESSWCLNELVEIKRCLRTERVDYAIPIFFNLKASDVRDQTGEFKDQFLALQNKYPAKSIKKWKKALSYVCKFAGLSFDKNSRISELDFIKMIVQKVDQVLTKIKEKDRNDSNNNLVRSKTSQVEAANLIKFDTYLRSRLYHFSKELEALNLQREDYNRFEAHGSYITLGHDPKLEETPPRGLRNLANSKVSQRSLPAKLTPSESSLTRDHIVPQDWPHLNHRRTNSFPEIMIYNPSSDETTVVQNHQFESQDSIDNFYQDKMIVDKNQVSIENNLERMSRKKPQFINFLGKDERLYHFPLQLEALDLQRNLENYNRDDYFKNLSPDIKESSSTPDHIVPQEWSHLPYRRTNSFPDNINQIYYSSCYESTVVENHEDKMIVRKNQPIHDKVSIDNNLQRMSGERVNEDISCCAFLRYFFKLSLCRA